MAGYRIFPPWLEILLGIIVMVSGLTLSHGLWTAGYVEAHVLALGLVGLVGVGNGVMRAAARARLEFQLNIVRRRESEILSALARMHRENKGGRAWLQSVGITDSSLCDYLLAIAAFHRADQ